MRNLSSLPAAFARIARSDQAGGILLILCTAASLAIANSPAGTAYLRFWTLDLAGLRLDMWVNDGLMAVFFLLVGLELKRELADGELADPKKAMLPIVAAVGGIAVPAALHFALNVGSATQAGMGIPMATDIAFALGLLAMLGKRVPASLKVFLTALAVMDDLGAIVVIALFYTTHVSVAHLAGVGAILAALVVVNRTGSWTRLAPYLLAGAVMWCLMLGSGVHPTIVGVLLAFVLPRGGAAGASRSPAQRLEHALHKPVTFLILPVFALANTGIVIGDDWLHDLLTPNGAGIVAGLVVGKPLGILLASAGAVMAGACVLPPGLAWRHIAGAGLLGGIGFTMSIFITNLAFAGNAALIDASKMAILVASSVAGIAGLAWLRWRGAHLAAPAAPPGRETRT